ERYGYTPYGLASVMVGDFSPRLGTAYSWEYQFASYRLDTESSLYQVRFRVLHPTLGAFVQRDPLALLAGDINLYRYADNIPISVRDPFGLLIWLLPAAPAAAPPVIGGGILFGIIVIVIVLLVLGLFILFNWNRLGLLIRLIIQCARVGPAPGPG